MHDPITLESYSRDPRYVARKAEEYLASAEANLTAERYTVAAGDAILWVLEDNPRARRFYERRGWIDEQLERYICAS